MTKIKRPEPNLQRLTAKRKKVIQMSWQADSTLRKELSENTWLEWYNISKLKSSNSSLIARMLQYLGKATAILC